MVLARKIAMLASKTTPPPRRWMRRQLRVSPTSKVFALFLQRHRAVLAVLPAGARVNWRSAGRYPQCNGAGRRSKEVCR